jgi:XTP/dITP diphosphohydrolase
MFPEIVLASRNQKKCGEIRDLLAPHGIDVLGLDAFPDAPETVEDGDTFAANAAKKAREIALVTSRWAIGEDSGLMVDALGGAPGVYSARYSDPGATDERNNAKLIAELANVPAEKRGAQYVCHVAVSDPAGNIQLTVERTCRGRIAMEARGENGFGYDPYFLIPEYHRTFGELSPVVKRVLSHRARAFTELIPALVRLLGQDSGR